MPIRIVDADIRHFKRAARSKRARTPEMQQLIKAVEELGSGKAKALIPERGETVARLRSRLAIASRAAGVKLKVAVQDDRVLFARKRGTAAAGKAGAAGRKQAIQQKALHMAKGGRRTISAADVLASLKADGASFGMARPATMVGAVLRSMKEFERTGRNSFRYKG